MIADTETLYRAAVSLIRLCSQLGIANTGRLGIVYAFSIRRNGFTVVVFLYARKRRATASANSLF